MFSFDQRDPLSFLEVSSGGTIDPLHVLTTHATPLAPFFDLQHATAFK